MKHHAPLALLSITACAAPALADDLLVEDFEDSTLTFTSSDGLFSDGASDYFTIVPLNSTPVTPSGGAYTGFQGSNFFAAEDIDDGNTRPSTQSLTFTVPITGYENLTFSGLLAAGGNDNPSVVAYDDEESLLVRATIDANPLQNLVAFEALEPGGDVTNNEVRIDADFDGVGDPAGFRPTSAFTAFNDLAITGTGSTLTLEVIVTSTDGNTEFAFDQFVIQGTPIPEPASLALLAAAGLALTRRRH